MTSRIEIFEKELADNQPLVHLTKMFEEIGFCPQATFEENRWGEMFNPTTHQLVNVRKLEKELRVLYKP